MPTITGASRVLAASGLALLMAADAVPAPAAQVRGQLQVRGRAMTYADGTVFRWRGVTGFALNEQVATGHEADARAFASWARTTGFNVVRLLVMLPHGWFLHDDDFTPEEGLAALPRTLALLRDADLYAHVTVLANTASIPGADYGAFVERAGRICAEAGNCALVEVANEPYHGTQAADVHSMTHLAAWAARVPRVVPTALGAPEDQDGVQARGAPVIVVHLDRGGDRWNRVRRVRQLEALSAETGRYVIDSEPIGAHEVEQSGRRDNAPDAFFAQGVLSRIFEVGSTFHSEDGLQARVPRSVQQACAKAFIDGTRIVQDARRLTFQNARWDGSPVADFRYGEPALAPNSAVRAYAGTDGRTGILVLLGVSGDPGVVMGGGWSRRSVLASRGAVQVWEIGR